MENRIKILNNLTKEIIESMTNPNKIILNNNYENDLKNFSEYFTKEEILEYNKKIELLQYTIPGGERILRKEWFKRNMDFIIYFLKDIQDFFDVLKNKRKKFLEKIFKSYINSMENSEKFCKFVMSSEYYFENYRHYFNEKEIEEYNRLWLDLEVENAIILSNNIKKWEENYYLILEGIGKMLIFLNDIS